MHQVLEMVGQIQQMLGSITGSVGTQINQTTLTTFGQIKDIAGAIANTLGTQMMQPTTTTHTATPVTATTATQTTTDPMHRVLEMIGQMQQMLGSITGSVGTKMSLGTVSTIGQIKDIAGAIANTLGTQVMQPTTTTHAATPVTATAPGLP